MQRRKGSNVRPGHHKWRGRESSAWFRLDYGASMLRRPKSVRRTRFLRLPQTRSERRLPLREAEPPAAQACQSAPVQSADFIAKRIAQIGEVKFGGTALAPTGRIFNALSAACYARVVEGFDLVRAIAGEPYRTAIGMRGWLAIEWLGYSESAGRGTNETPTLRVHLALRHADCAEDGVIELLRDCNVVRADKN